MFTLNFLIFILFTSFLIWDGINAFKKEHYFNFGIDMTLTFYMCIRAIKIFMLGVG